MWTTLRRTSRALSHLLGDYHEMRNVCCTNGCYDEEMSYDEFMDELLSSMMGDSDTPGMLTLSTDCVWAVDEEGHHYIDSSAIDIMWDGDHLRVYRGGLCAYLSYVPLSWQRDHYILIGDSTYIPGALSAPIGPLLKVIADELPALYRKMTEVKRLSFKDVDMN